MEKEYFQQEIDRKFEVADNSIEMVGFVELYSNLAKIIPPRNHTFNMLDFETAVACEVICASICHQINWDFLRKTILEYTKSNPAWIHPKNIRHISSKSIQTLLASYNKPERIRAKERAKMLRSIGELLYRRGYQHTDIFFDHDGNIKNLEFILEFFKSSVVFTNDPEEKKIQLLLQNLSDYPRLSSLMNYYKPAIDYHIIRLYLRRGMIIPRNQEAIDYIFSHEKQRTEKTVAVIRRLCSDVFSLVNWITNIDLKTINSIEWWVGRSICTKDFADCNLSMPKTKWLHLHYDKCPFSESCHAYKYDKKYLTLTEPLYKGNSY